MKKEIKILIISFIIVCIIIYLVLSYRGILIFTKGYNEFDYLIFNILGESILVGISTYIATKYVSIFISQKEFNRNNKINLNIQEKRHALYNFDNFLEEYSDGNIYFGIEESNRKILDYVYKKYHTFKIILNEAYINDKVVENILNFPFIWQDIMDGNFTNNWKEMMKKCGTEGESYNVKLLRSIIKKEDYNYFEKFSNIIEKIKYFKIVNMNAYQGCVLLVTANKIVVNKISCIPNETNGIYLYFDGDREIQFIGFNHNYDGEEEATNLLGFKYSNENEKTQPAHIDLKEYMNVK